MDIKELARQFNENWEEVKEILEEQQEELKEHRAVLEKLIQQQEG